MSGGDRRREIIDAMLEALRHTLGRDEHMPFLKQLVEGQIGPVTFAEIADGLASIDVSGRDPEWREVWAELIETIRRRRVAGMVSAKPGMALPAVRRGTRQ